MSKYTFICQEESTPYSMVVEAKRVVEFRADSLEEILQEFEHFLRGAGFRVKGQLDFVDEYAYESEPSDDYDSYSDYEIAGGPGASFEIDKIDIGTIEGEKLYDFSEIPQNNWPFGDMKPRSDCASER